MTLTPSVGRVRVGIRAGPSRNRKRGVYRSGEVRSRLKGELASPREIVVARAQRQAAKDAERC